ncbi:nitroreductase family protein [Desulfoferrobacter suflitae]|uniref:nitroreductase family protein n=1 Tax=Desulfoferrobacter suflitae TaxID=2865782 RepID=UPI002164C4C2|nr:nitroreductase family protein [Desulfoferrobacter suflitae]MCK8601517.1 nitroreductase family protein [Desulfoferrobacter suflitae]
MGELMKAIKDRRSIRKYEDKMVPEELLNQVLEAVQWAPSWANTQCWEIVVIKESATKQKLQETMGKGNPATKAIVDAPVLLAVCGKLKSSGFYKDQVTTKFGDWFLFDLGIATQNLCLAAHDLGLGTVIVGLFDHAKAAQIVGLPEGYELVTLIPLGYPAKISSAPKRREIREFSHYEKF